MGVYLEVEGIVGGGEECRGEGYVPTIGGLLGGISRYLWQDVVEDNGVVRWCVALEEGDADIHLAALHHNLVCGVCEVAHYARGELLHSLWQKPEVVRHNQRVDMLLVGCQALCTMLLSSLLICGVLLLTCFLCVLLRVDGDAYAYKCDKKRSK